MIPVTVYRAFACAPAHRPTCHPHLFGNGIMRKIFRRLCVVSASILFSLLVSSAMAQSSAVVDGVAPTAVRAAQSNDQKTTAEFAIGACGDRCGRCWRDGRGGCGDCGGCDRCGGCGMHGCGHGCRGRGSRYAVGASYNCGCNGSYKFPVPPLSTYHWIGLYSHQLMTDYHSPWRFPPITPYVDEPELPTDPQVSRPQGLTAPVVPVEFVRSAVLPQASPHPHVPTPMSEQLRKLYK
jgi:hypothetical protein